MQCGVFHKIISSFLVVLPDFVPFVSIIFDDFLMIFNIFRKIFSFVLQGRKNRHILRHAGFFCIIVVRSGPGL